MATAVPVHTFYADDEAAGLHRLAPCYVGVRSAAGCAVIVWPGAVCLPIRLDVRNHSPCGFEWGYSGSGPAQLALALMLDVTGNTDLALRLYQTFKRQVLAGMNQHPTWLMFREDLDEWIAGYVGPK